MHYSLKSKDFSNQGNLAGGPYSPSRERVRSNSYRLLRLEQANHKPFHAARKMERQLSFLEPYQDLIHSLLLVGSTVYKAQSTNSDVDIVIVTKPEGHEPICNFLFERELDESLQGKCTSNIDYTVLAPEHTEKLFQVSSPFAYSIRHGAVIWDDGFLRRLKTKNNPRLPAKEYYTDCLYEKIAAPYFGLLKKIQAEAKEYKCSPGCTRKAKGCGGLLSAQLFAKLVVQMLYVTLPSKGMIPLTKNDVVAYARIAYGSWGESVARESLRLMRSKNSTFCFSEFATLKKFAVLLFKEILKTAGLSHKVRTILFDAARMTRKEFHSISNPSLKNCVL